MDIIIDLLKTILSFVKRILDRLLNRFMELNIFEKVLIINTLLAFFAIILPVARYFIFETWFYINNPLAVYMIAIVIIIYVLHYLSDYLSPLIQLAVKSLANLYYMGWVIYIHLSRELSRAPYELTAGYYLNIAVPVIFTVFSALSFLFYGRE
ncbi:MAG: hypothetical protein CVV44_00725 [Spirochaetae bacterium HGW-Spirochaetae-1]|nr:MAG: hypothetical protein CVV44_00725 [Spirochaetae bacterium HGW-Spirochaetae-1]